MAATKPVASNGRRKVEPFRMRLSEIMTIVIAFISQGTFKDFYTLQVLPYWLRLSPESASTVLWS